MSHIDGSVWLHNDINTLEIESYKVKIVEWRKATACSTELHLLVSQCRKSWEWADVEPKIKEFSYIGKWHKQRRKHFLLVPIIIYTLHVFHHTKPRNDKEMITMSLFRHSAISFSTHFFDFLFKKLSF